MNRKEILHKLDCAIKIFLEKHKNLLDVEVNERSITYKLAECMTSLFEEWDIDCEYNRDGYDKKLVGINPKGVSSDDISMTTIYPDIIVHHRKKSGQENNLLVIEAKKNASDSSRKDDTDKLKKIMDQLKYRFGVFLYIDTENHTLFSHSILYLEEGIIKVEILPEVKNSNCNNYS